MNYTCNLGFHVGEATVDVKKGETVSYINQYLTLSDGRKFYAPYFHSAIKAKWVVPSETEQETKNINLKIKVVFPESAISDSPEKIETPSSKNLVWDISKHWRIKVSEIEKMGIEDLVTVFNLEKGKMKDRIKDEITLRFPDFVFDSK